MYTLVLQGPIDPITPLLISSADRCSRISEIILSTWTTEKVRFRSKKMEVIYSPPLAPSRQNRESQIFSTLQGLKLATQPYTIKLRSTKWPHTKFDAIIDRHQSVLPKCLSSNLYFRPWNFHPFHISDMLFVDETSTLLEAFTQLQKRVEKRDFYRPYYGKLEKVKKGYDQFAYDGEWLMAAEQLITDEILSARDVTQRDKQAMLENFDLILLQESCLVHNQHRRLAKFVNESNIIKSMQEL